MNRDFLSEINDRPPDKRRRKDVSEVNVMDYSTSLATSSWDIERGLADKIMNHVNKHRLSLRLDNLTRGRGNCFMIAILQQLQQDHVYNLLSHHVQRLADEFCHKKFRKAIRNYVFNSHDTRISEIKNNYNVAKSAGVYSESWYQYWQGMMKEGKWADVFFVQATAVFLNMDLKIVDTACNEESPFYIIKAKEASAPLATLSIGLVTNIHYQSLIPVSSTQGTNKAGSSTKNSSVSDSSMQDSSIADFSNVAIDSLIEVS